MTQDVPLATRTTLELGGRARYLLEVGDTDTLVAGLRWAGDQGLPVFVLGGGSNVVVADRGFDGLVLVMATRGIAERPVGDRIELTVQAGEPWDDVVSLACARGWAGIECLSGIPGQAGAVPIQNVGAYGQDVAETIVAVTTIDVRTQERRVRRAVECGFGYRHSIWKRASSAAPKPIDASSAAPKLIDASSAAPKPIDEVVTEVTFALRPSGAPTVRYPELARALKAKDASPLDLVAVREVVLSLRRSKSMVFDPQDPHRRSVGSFFTNPVVSAERAAEVVERALRRGIVARAEEVPQWTEADASEGAPRRVKLAAGWLIERAGMERGLRRGSVGISPRHALALVHYGGGTAVDLLGLAREVVERVHEVFGVTLRPEPDLVGFDAGWLASWFDGAADRSADRPADRSADQSADRSADRAAGSGGA